ncbi:hypothetical protein [Dolichospermum heterosporum]|jgi:hypothetical protein|uniref:Uncharacterized protein n=1 Tax=Dolichospermum heterosporum TAC447 TaxID=747523 RepID=A0ABY5LV90_9CYAN|nr:hypothetical protein [Dolichospermum heterosporum]UUO14944.1 hypothetical protein NG743_23515 [Dolichospermum heterosporum TAC447]
MANTIKDFKLTAITRGNIICPKCAACMGIHDPNSFQLILTDRARDHMEDRLLELRSFTKGLEAYLTSKIYSISISADFGTPYEDEKNSYFQDLAEKLELQKNEFKVNSYGIFEGHDGIKKHAEAFKKQIDPYRFVDNFNTEIPDLSLSEIKINSSEDEKKQACESYLKYLTGEGIERTSNGLIYNLIAEQTKIENKLDDEKLYGVVKEIVKEIFPTLSKYYDFIDVNINSLGDKTKGAKDNVKRARLLLVMLHANDFYKNPQRSITPEHTEILSEFLKQQYKLPEKTTVSIELLSQLVASRVLIDNKSNLLNFWNSPDSQTFSIIPYTDFLKNLFDWNTWNAAVAKLTGVEKKYTNWLKHLDRLINVACTNEVEKDKEEFNVNLEGEDIKVETVAYADQMPSKDLPENNEESKKEVPQPESVLQPEPVYGKPKDTTVRKYQPCGWSPSKRKSHSIVILGSPGTGKTCLLQSGLAKLRLHAATAGITITPEDNASRKDLFELEENYRKGDVKNSTAVNLALNLQVSQLENTQYINRFTFIDIPGHKVSSLVSQKEKERVDSDLRRLLFNADTIIFQFDFWSDDTFLNHLRENNPEAFQQQFVLSDQVKESHETRRDRIPQFDLQWELLKLLAEEGQKDIDKKFIFVFPKIDTLAFSSNQDNDKKYKQHYFFRDFYKQLKDMRLIVPSGSNNVNPDEENFNNMYSVAGAGIKGKTQFQICQDISRLGKESIKKVADVFQSDTPVERKQTLTDHIEKHLIQFIEDRFHGQDKYGIDKTWYLPVSALGKTPNLKNGRFSLEGKSPNPIIAEYVFLLPILLAFEEQKKETDALKQKAEQEDKGVANM